MSKRQPSGKKPTAKKTAPSRAPSVKSRKSPAGSAAEASTSGGIAGIIVFIAVITLIAAILYAAYYFTKDRLPDPVVPAEEYLDVNIYYVNKSDGKTGTETRRVKKATNAEIISNVLGEWVLPPKNAAFSVALPADVKIIGEPSLDQYGTVEITFSESYSGLPPTQQVLCRAALVYTLTDLSFVDSVHIYVGDSELLRTTGEPFGLLNRANIKIDTDLTVITEAKDILVYFAADDGSGLIGEARTVEIEQGKSIEKYAIDALLSGPNDHKLIRTLPSGVTLNSIHIDDKICYVDLSHEFLYKIGDGSTSERLAVFSIVNTLTQFNQIKKVQILVNGAKISATPAQGIDLANPLERDEDLITE